ncbi:hypothetical protein KP509_31G065200 [Ceratopteris richardii]|uniref:Uncharacterized protein n=1 Tax=Ceratopteris richardii TaxID=49495 RepID=A0A8T2R0U0_CERRI|nr:hypothetical protein KP509_31G065200 [Ceratopteris richardii]
MSARGPRCAKHPSLPLVGVCALCLRERLAGLAEAGGGSSNAPRTHGARKKQSPGRIVSSHSTYKQPQQPTERRGSDRLPNSTSVQPRKESLHRDLHARISAISAHCSTDKGTGDSSDAESTSLRAKPEKLNEPFVRGSLLKPAASDSPTAPAVEPAIVSSKCSFNQAVLSDTGSNNCRGIDVVTDVDVDDKANVKIPLEMLSVSVVSEEPSVVSLDDNRILPPDIKVPILENEQHTVSGTRKVLPLQKDVSVGCTSPLMHTCEMSKRTPLKKQVHHMASMGREPSSSIGSIGLRKSLLSSEPTNNKHVKDAELALCDTPKNIRNRKKTLSSLFTLDEWESPSSKSKMQDSKSKLTGRGDALFSSTTNFSAQNVFHAKAIQRRCRHGSFSERVEQNAYRFPVPESTNSKPLSWFSALFRRRKKKSRPKVVDAVASYSEHNSGWEGARQSWEAPRPSSWEQFRLSSFEGPRSSWEPSRPSWEGVTRASDADSVFSGFDFLTESVGRAREDTLTAHRNPQELLSVDCTDNFSEAKLSVESRRSGSMTRPLAIKTLLSDDKAAAHTVLSAKATLMQRDVSTQTTPPRSSDATEIFIQERLQRRCHRNGQQYSKSSHAVWSRVWAKTFSNSRWVFKQRHHKEAQPKERGSNLMFIDGAHEHDHMKSGRPSLQETSTITSNRHSAFTCMEDIKEHEAWDTFYSPLQNGGDMMTRVFSNSIGDIQNDKHVDKAGVSNFSLESGLLKFYLTPVRGYGRTKQGIYGV